jgi:uncharacterized protein (DUF1810 family)
VAPPNPKCDDVVDVEGSPAAALTVPMNAFDHFKNAQNSPDAGFQSALKEIRAGRKTGHWIWYVFPQISGLGRSGAAQTFAIDGEEEAAAYLRDSELRSRYLLIAEAVDSQLKRGTPLRALMGSDIDAKKLVSSLTLFGYVSRKLRDSEGVDAYSSLIAVADEVLSLAAAEGYPPCAYTLKRLQG